MRPLALFALAAAVAGCAGPGTGWSRASDLSLYGSAHAYARIAWQRNVLCDGWSAERASASQEREYGGRDAAVRAALARRYGEAALAAADRHFVARVPCGDVPDLEWRARYGRLLHLLEIRLGLMPEREG
jgi:hypothetical protein